MQNESVKVRFAPSPTGPFHIGGARSALFNWLLAKSTGGKMVLRIEDTDLSRSTRESEENIKEALHWLGMDWDEGVDVGGPEPSYRQSERLDIYRRFTEQLLAEGKAYYCYETEEELQEAQERRRKEGKPPVYDGRCRNLTAEERAEFEAMGRKPAIRLRCPENETLAFDDLVRGHISFDSNGIGDFIIVKSDGMPVYNYAVVIDDALMGITHVIRAEEHLSNTPRQLVIYRALGFAEPKFGHISLILGEDGKKMSKRHGATSVQQYRDLGYLPEAIVNFLALLGWAPEGEEELFDIPALIEHFSMDRVSKNPAVVNIEKLNWINFHYMKEQPSEKLLELTLPHLVAAGYVPADLSEELKEKVMAIVDSLRNYIYFGAQVVEHAKPFFVRPNIEDPEMKEVLQAETTDIVLTAFAEQIRNMDSWEATNLNQAIKAVQKETGVKGKNLYAPLRIALMGAMHGPDLAGSATLLGKDECLYRLQHVK